MTKPRVLYLIDHFGTGGAQTCVRELMQRTDLPWEAYCLSIRKTQDENIYEASNLFKTGSTSRLSPKPLLEAVKLIRKFNIDIVHPQLPRSLLVACAIKATCSSSFRLVYHEHGSILSSLPLYRLLLNSVGRKIDAIITVSNAAEIALGKVSGLNSVPKFTLYNGVDLSLIQRAGESTREGFGIRPDVFVIGFVGRLSQEKGAGLLIDLMARLEFEAHAIIIGEGPDAKILREESVRRGLSDKITFLGMRPSPYDIMRLMDVLVMPSYSDAFPRASLEAQALGVPVAASRIGGIPETIPPECRDEILFEAGNIGHFAAIIRSLYADPKKRVAYSQRGLEWVKQFDISNFIHRQHALYETILRDR